MEHPEHPGAPTISVTVHAPGFLEPKQFTWPKTKKVGEAAAEAAVAFGIQVESPTFQKQDDMVLDRDKPLVAAGVKDGDSLELVSFGGGV